MPVGRPKFWPVAPHTYDSLYSSRMIPFFPNCFANKNKKKEKKKSWRMFIASSPMIPQMSASSPTVLVAANHRPRRRWSPSQHSSSLVPAGHRRHRSKMPLSSSMPYASVIAHLSAVAPPPCRPAAALNVAARTTGAPAEAFSHTG